MGSTTSLLYNNGTSTTTIIDSSANMNGNIVTASNYVNSTNGYKIGGNYTLNNTSLILNSSGGNGITITNNNSSGTSYSQNFRNTNGIYSLLSYRENHINPNIVGVSLNTSATVYY